MKLLKRYIEKDRSGTVRLHVEDDEDIWHAYNLITAESDFVKASAVRRITTESSTGSTESKRIRLNLTIAVVKVAYSASTGSTGDSTPIDSSTSGGGGGRGSSGEATLHLSGPVSEQNQHVKLGAYHTLDIVPGRDFSITKSAGGWDSIALSRISESCDEARGLDVGVVICGEGVASICIVGGHTTITKQRIEVAIPRKRKEMFGTSSSSVEKSTLKFQRQIYEAVEKHFDLEKLKLIIIASPGFVKDQIFDFILAEAIRTGNKSILTSKSKFQKLHSPSPHVHSIAETLSSPQVASTLSDSKFAKESKALDQFHKMLGVDELRAWYGEDHVKKAAERGAIGTLMISDSLFRASNPQRRQQFVKLTEEVKKYRGEVLIFSSMHETGTRLNELTGVAAILTYPLDIEVVEEEERQLKNEATSQNP